MQVNYDGDYHFDIYMILHFAQVMHDCRAIAGCLFAQFAVKLTNVFDTQVNIFMLHTYFRSQHDLWTPISCNIFLVFFLYVLRWQMSCVSTPRQEGFSPTESVLSRRL